MPLHNHPAVRSVPARARIGRAALVAAVASASLVLPAVAAAEPSISIAPTGALGPEGLSAATAVTYTCDPGQLFPSIDVQLLQATGKRVAVYFGSLNNGICDGTAGSVIITVRPPLFGGPPIVPLKQGDASVSATLLVAGTAFRAGPQLIRLKR